MLSLIGTSDPVHMQHDLAIAAFELTAAELATVENAGLMRLG
jgi:hypothetical protein